MDIPDADVVPLTILTGFLGAGKTTLLNRILNGDHGLRVAVLVNDFGAINIDAELVVGVQDDVISLANGCVCCSIRDDLIETVLEVIERRERPEFIVLEASGVADPSGIALAFVQRGLRRRVRLDSVTCVVDTEQVFAHPEQMPLKLRQVAFADMLIFNKVELAGPEQVEKVRAWVESNFNRLRIVETNHCQVPLEILLSVGRMDPSGTGLDRHALEHAGCDDTCQHVHHGHDHAQTFSTWSYETDQTLSLEMLRDKVRKLPGNIYRCKGVIFAADAPDRRAILQVVGRRVDISLGDPWGDRPRRSRIVVIGAHGTIQSQMLQETMDGCRASGLQEKD